MSATTSENYGEVSYENIKKLFRDTSDPVLTATEVAEAFDITPQAANYRIKRMLEQNDLGRKEVGSSAVVYWLRG